MSRFCSLSDSLPPLMVAVWFTMRVFVGTILPVEGEWLWQLTAIIPAVTCWIATFRPNHGGRIRLWAGITAVSWLVLWSGMIATALIGRTPLSRSVSWIGVWQYMTAAVLISYIFGRSPRPGGWMR